MAGAQTKVISEGAAKKGGLDEVDQRGSQLKKKTQEVTEDIFRAIRKEDVFLQSQEKNRSTATGKKTANFQGVGACNNGKKETRNEVKLNSHWNL